MKPKSYHFSASSRPRHTAASRIRTPLILAGSVAALLAGPDDAAGASFTWNNATGNWSDNTQWSDVTTPPSSDNTTQLTFGGSGVTGYTSTVDTGGGASDPWIVNGITLNSTASVAEAIDNSNTNGVRFLGTNPLLNQLGTGAFNISAPLSLGTGIPALTLGGDGAGLVTISSIIGEQSAGLGLIKIGLSSFATTNTNSYTGATTIQRGTMTLGGTGGSIAASSGITLRGRSTLALNNTSAANNGDRIAGTFTSAPGGGIFNFINDSAASTNYSESIGAVTTGTGTLNINTSLADTGQTSILTLDSLARTAGGTLRLSGNGLGVDDRNRISVTTAPTVTAGILPYAIMIDPASSGTGVVNFATHSGAGGEALTKYATYETGAQTTWSANTVNARPAADQTLSAPRTLNSLVLDDTIDLLALTSDRIITTGQSGVGAVVQTGGTSTMLASGTSEVVLAFGASEAVFNIEGTLIHERNGTTVMTGTGGLTKTGPGTLILRGDGISARYGINVAGPLNVNQGLFDISLDGSGLAVFSAINLNGGDFTLRNTSGSTTRTYATGIVVNADGTFSFGVVAPATVSATFNFNTLAINNGATLTLAAGPNASGSSTPKLTISGATTLNSDGTINTGTGTTVTLAGAVGQDASSRSLTKDGPGTLILSATNTYTGTTQVNGGILRMSGLSDAASAVSVTTGTLDGTGTVNGTTTVAAGGTVAPGTASTIGTLNTAKVTFASGATFDVDLNATTADKLAVTGDLNLADSTLSAQLLTGIPADGTVFTIATYTGTLNGTFSGLPEASTVVIAGKTYTLKYADAGNNITLTLPPPVATPYELWALAKITNIDPLADATPEGDPDHDGASNLEEFAFNGIPLDGSDNGQVYMLTADSDYVGDPSGANELILTVAVRADTPTFAGTPSPTAIQAVDGITYTIQGSTTLDSFDTVVNVVPTPVTNDLPPVGEGYEYRSFSLDGSNGLPGKGFLRAKASN